MTKYYTLDDRFLRELSELHDVERNSLDLLSKLQQESKDQQLAGVLNQFETETKTNIGDLEKVFQTIGQTPQRVTGATVVGLQEERRLLDARNAPPEELTTWDMHAAAKVAGFEVDAYRSLVDTARLMGRQDARQLLENGLKRTEGISDMLLQLRQQRIEREPAFAGSQTVRSDYRSQQGEA